jgi:hypothetical protein
MACRGERPNLAPFIRSPSPGTWLARGGFRRLASRPIWWSLAWARWSVGLAATLGGLRIGVVVRLAGLSLSLAVPAWSLGAEGPQPVLDREEAVLARLNCHPTDMPAGWKPLAQWTFPGRGFPNRLALRAFHASSFGLPPDDVDYMVCHLGWFRSPDESRRAFRDAAGSQGQADPPFDVGDRVAVRVREVPAHGGHSARTSYDLVLARGSFLSEVRIVATAPWSSQRIESLCRRIDDRLLAQVRAGGSETAPVRLLKEKLADPSRAPRCAQRCALHNRAFLALRVPVQYGLRVATLAEAEGHQDERASQFPNAAPRSIEGGCIVDELVDAQWICACEVCTANAEHWRAEHPPVFIDDFPPPPPPQTPAQQQSRPGQPPPTPAIR